MEKEKYIEDLKEIRQIMNQSSRFVSLSGMSGISIGIIGLAGAYIAYTMGYWNNELATYNPIDSGTKSIGSLPITGFITLITAIISGIFFTYRKTSKAGKRIWTPQTKRLLTEFAIPLLSGGLTLFILASKGLPGLILPLSMMFYGLGLINAGKHTLKAIRHLGILEIALGILALYFISASLILWTIGFGFLHIIYGIIIPMKRS